MNIMFGNSAVSGKEKKFDVKGCPSAPPNEEKIPFYDAGNRFGAVSLQTNDEIDIPCSDKCCILSFNSFEKLEKHLNFGQHKYETEIRTQLSKVADKWVKRFEQNTSSSAGVESTSTSKLPRPPTNSITKPTTLKRGWAIPSRIQRRLTKVQKQLLNTIYDEGEKSGNKSSPEEAEQKLRKTLRPNEYLPVSTIKSYFSRRTRQIKDGKVSKTNEQGILIILSLKLILHLE